MFQWQQREHIVDTFPKQRQQQQQLKLLARYLFDLLRQVQDAFARDPSRADSGLDWLMFYLGIESYFGLVCAR